MNDVVKQAGVTDAMNGANDTQFALKINSLQPQHVGEFRQSKP